MCGYVLSLVRGGSGGGMVNSVPMLFMVPTCTCMFVCISTANVFNCPRVKTPPLA